MTAFHGPSLGPFQWDDPLLLESQLTEDERLIRDTAREFAAGEAEAARRSRPIWRRRPIRRSSG